MNEMIGILCIKIEIGIEKGVDIHIIKKVERSGIGVDKFI